MSTRLFHIANELEAEAQQLRQTGHAVRELSLPLKLDDVIRAHVQRALRREGSITNAALSLGVSRRSVHRYINQWNLVT